DWWYDRQVSAVDHQALGQFQLLDKVGDKDRACFRILDNTDFQGVLVLQFALERRRLTVAQNPHRRRAVPPDGAGLLIDHYVNTPRRMVDQAVNIISGVKQRVADGGIAYAQEMHSLA